MKAQDLLFTQLLEGSKPFIFPFSFTTAADGKQYETLFYNLDAIISVGYRINSIRGTQFRIWATQRLREYIVKGFTLDDERLKNPDQPFDYFEELTRRIQDAPYSDAHGRLDQETRRLHESERAGHPDPCGQHLARAGSRTRRERIR